jgi:methylisocitrate lyase
MIADLDRSVPVIVIMARTEALQLLGHDEAIHRLKAAQDLGVDVLFLEGLRSKEEMRTAVADLAPMPILLNLIEHGVTPTLSHDEAKDMGFRVIILSLATVAPAYVGMRDTLTKLKKTGLMGTPEDVTSRKIFQVCGLNDFVDLDMRAGGEYFGEGSDAWSRREGTV